jgi:hypothetical protein
VQQIKIFTNIHDEKINNPQQPDTAKILYHACFSDFSDNIFITAQIFKNEYFVIAKVILAVVDQRCDPVKWHHKRQKGNCADTNHCFCCSQPVRILFQQEKYSAKYKSVYRKQ